MAIERVGVVGAGVMGSEIAQAAAAAGLAVVLRDVDQAALDRGIAHVRAICQRAVERGRMEAAEAEAIVGRITPALDDGALAGEDVARALGKTPVQVRECPGFLVNRLLTRGMLAAYRMTEALGADPAAVDVAVESGGPAPMGPFALGDLVGLDTLDHIQRDLAAA